MCAACNGHAHVVEMLLQHGAKVDMTTEVSAFTATKTEVTMNAFLSVVILALYIDY